jgi:hypothetical protein
LAAVSPVSSDSSLRWWPHGEPAVAVAAAEELEPEPEPPAALAMP